MRFFLVLLLCYGQLAADTLALYLSWYQDPTTTMTIQWHTPLEEPEDEVAFQPPSGKWKTAAGSYIELSSRLIHTAFLQNLTPDTEYAFRVGKDPTVYKFRTAPNTLDHPLRFCIGGDLYHTPDLFRKMCRTVAEKDPLFAVLGGDIAYALNKNPFQLRSTAKKQWFAFLKEWKELMISKEGRVIPFLLLPGNHDIKPDDADLFFALFAFPEQKLYRTVDFGNYLRFIFLDSDCFEPIEGEQTDWLQGTLAERGDFSYRFAVYHMAAFPSHYSFNGTIPQKIRAHWCPLFDQYQLPAAFENHNHTFKKTFPLRNQQIDDHGTIYFGDGCWGALPRVTKNHWYLAKQGRENHVYLIDLDTKSAKIKAIDLQGKIIDYTELPAGK